MSISNIFKHILLLCSLLFILFSTTLLAFADEVDDLSAEADEIQAQIDAKQIDLDQAGVEYEEAKQRQVNAEADKLAALDEKNKLERDIVNIQDRLGQRVEHIYKAGETSMLDMILSVRSFKELSLALDALMRMNNSDAEMIHDIELKKFEAEEQSEIAATKEQEAAIAAEHAAEAKESAEADIADLEEIYDGLTEAVAQILYERQIAAAAAESSWNYYYDDDTNYNYTYDSGYTSEDASYSSSSSASTSAYSNSQVAPSDANDIVARAYSALGSNYVWGGIGGSDGGYDCSGLVSYAVTGQNTRLGTTNTFMGYQQVSDPQPGDIVTNSGHCGIYIGDGKMIHSSTYGTGVIIGDVQDGMIAVRP